MTVSPVFSEPIFSNQPHARRFIGFYDRSQASGFIVAGMIKNIVAIALCEFCFSTMNKA